MNVSQIIIARFGGTRRMAAELAVPASTIQSWKSSGLIPAARQLDVLRAAQRIGIALAPADFFPPNLLGEGVSRPDVLPERTPLPPASTPGEGAAAGATEPGPPEAA